MQRSLEPGVSVSLLAQENDINVNMLFKWRRQLREGVFDGVTRRQAMLPVTIVDEKSGVASSASPSKIAEAVSDCVSTADRSGLIEIQMAGVVLRFDGKADLAAVRAVLSMLRS